MIKVIKFFDSARFMASSLPNLNLTEGIYKIKCKDCDCFLKYGCVKGNLKYKCLSCNKDYLNKFDEELKKKIRNTFKFEINNKKKRCLSLWIYGCLGRFS